MSYMQRAIDFGHCSARLAAAWPCEPVTVPEASCKTYHSAHQGILRRNGCRAKRMDVWQRAVDNERFNPAFRSDEWRSRITDGNPERVVLTYVGRLGAGELPGLCGCDTSTVTPFALRAKACSSCYVSDGFARADDGLVRL